MNIRNTRPAKLLIILPLFAAFALVWQMGSVAAVPGVGAADTSWTDGFESYPACGADPDCATMSPAQRTQTYFPHENWTHSGLPDAFVNNDRKRSGSNSLKMHGLSDQFGGSIAYRALGGYPSYEIDFYAMSNKPDDPNYPVRGGHLKTVGVELSTAPDFSGNDRGLFAFTVEDINGDNNPLEIRGGYFEPDGDLAQPTGIYLQNWVPNTWYHITIRYEPLNSTQVKLTYFVNEIQRGEQTVDVQYFENSLQYLGLWAGNGQVWYDDVRVTASTDPFSFDTPPPPTPPPTPTPLGDDYNYLPLIRR